MIVIVIVIVIMIRRFKISDFLKQMREESYPPDQIRAILFKDSMGVSISGSDIVGDDIEDKAEQECRRCVAWLSRGGDSAGHFEKASRIKEEKGLKEKD